MKKNYVSRYNASVLQLGTWFKHIRAAELRGAGQVILHHWQGSCIGGRAGLDPGQGLQHGHNSLQLGKQAAQAGRDGAVPGPKFGDQNVQAADCHLYTVSWVMCCK